MSSGMVYEPDEISPHTPYLGVGRKSADFLTCRLMDNRQTELNSYHVTM